MLKEEHSDDEEIKGNNRIWRAAAINAELKPLWCRQSSTLMLVVSVPEAVAMLLVAV